MTKQELVDSYVKTCMAVKYAPKIERQQIEGMSQSESWTFALDLENAAWLAVLRDPFPSGTFESNFLENLEDIKDVWGVTIPQT